MSLSNSTEMALQSPLSSNLLKKELEKQMSELEHLIGMMRGTSHGALFYKYLDIAKENAVELRAKIKDLIEGAGDPIPDKEHFDALCLGVSKAVLTFKADRDSNVKDVAQKAARLLAETQAKFSGFRAGLPDRVEPAFKAECEAPVLQLVSSIPSNPTDLEIISEPESTPLEPLTESEHSEFNLLAKNQPDLVRELLRLYRYFSDKISDVMSEVNFIDIDDFAYKTLELSEDFFAIEKDLSLFLAEAEVQIPGLLEVFKTIPNPEQLKLLPSPIRDAYTTTLEGHQLVQGKLMSQFSKLLDLAARFSHLKKEFASHDSQLGNAGRLSNSLNNQFKFLDSDFSFSSPLAIIQGKMGTWNDSLYTLKQCSESLERLLDRVRCFLAERNGGEYLNSLRLLGEFPSSAGNAQISGEIFGKIQSMVADPNAKEVVALHTVELAAQNSNTLPAEPQIPQSEIALPTVAENTPDSPSPSAEVPMPGLVEAGQEIPKPLSNPTPREEPANKRTRFPWKKASESEKTAEILHRLGKHRPDLIDLYNKGDYNSFAKIVGNLYAMDLSPYGLNSSVIGITGIYPTALKMFLAIFPKIAPYLKSR